MKRTILTLLAFAGIAAAQSVVVPAQAFFPSTGYAPVVQATYNATSKTATIATFNVQCPAASQNPIATSPQAGIQPVTPLAQSSICPAGVYRMNVYIENASGTNGGGSVTNTVGFHSTATAQTANPATTLTCSTGDYQAGSTLFYSDGTANITLATAVTSTCTYNVVAVLERLF